MVRCRLTYLAISGAVLVGIPAPPTAQAQPGPTEQSREDRLEGTFRYAGGSRERTALERSIEASVDAVSWILQPIARRRLTETNPISKWTTVSFAGDRISVVRPGLVKIAAPADGREIKWTNDHGDRAKLRFTWQGSKLVQHIHNNQGGSEVVYSPSADGQTIRISVRVYSQHLPVPVKYRLTYRRSD